MVNRGFFFILGFHSQKDQFIIGIRKYGEVLEMGTFHKGINNQEKKLLIQTITSNQIQNKEGTIYIDPGICVELSFRVIENGKLRDAVFNTFKFDIDWEQCTWERLILHNTSVNQEVAFTNLDKVIWENPLIRKDGLLSYLSEVSSHMLPFLKERALTVIRYPNGIKGESFFQKNCPEYAPSFIQTTEKEGTDFVVCDDLSTLLWLGNQLAIEFHVPFQTIHEECPFEIVFDLDPPSRASFSLAVKAALELHRIFAGFDIVSFPKLSGSKGIQIHIPIADRRFTYSETRLFTAFIANYLVDQFPDDFTIERFKKNRGNKLYIDYVQHAEGKTLICPYSTRGKEDATVATPLFWDEVNEKLKLETFNIPFVLDRLTKIRCPMEGFFEQNNDSLTKIISMLKEKSNEYS